MVAGESIGFARRAQIDAEQGAAINAVCPWLRGSFRKVVLNRLLCRGFALSSDRGLSNIPGCVPNTRRCVSNQHESLEREQGVSRWDGEEGQEKIHV